MLRIALFLISTFTALISYPAQAFWEYEPKSTGLPASLDASGNGFYAIIVCEQFGYLFRLDFDTPILIPEGGWGVLRNDAGTPDVQFVLPATTEPDEQGKQAFLVPANVITDDAMIDVISQGRSTIEFAYGDDSGQKGSYEFSARGSTRSAAAMKTYCDGEALASGFSQKARLSHAQAYELQQYKRYAEFHLDQGDGVKAYGWFERLADRANLELYKGDEWRALAYFEMARLQLQVTPRGTRIDQAISFFEGSANLGNRQADYRLGRIFYFEGNKRQNFDRAFFHLRRAANDGIAAAQNILGYMYKNGQGTKANEKTAHRWFLKSAQAGHIYAIHSMGEVYRDGVGVDADAALAAEWFKKAADQGDEHGHLDFAKVALANEGIATNPETLKSLRFAALKGMEEAQFLLAETYNTGSLGAVSEKRAYAWYSIAAQNGDETAEKMRDEIALNLPTEIRIEAQEAAIECVESRYENCEGI